ncbi:MAG: DUF2070 family protein [Thaumarchaeota archaeon]|nr:DUF2070 family protein [Nitrososphaerota archaeon]
MSAPTDNVHSIHRWHTLTLINPSSHRHSLVFSLAVTATLALAVHFSYVEPGPWTAVHVAAAMAVLPATQLADRLVIRNREHSKAIHLSLFGTATWLMAASAGVAAAAVLGRDAIPMQHLVVGMMVFAAFRIGMLTSVLGVGIRRAWAACAVQPLALYCAIVPFGMWEALADPVSLAFGAAFLAIATAWSTMTDRAGRPPLRSTHEVIQAYLTSLRRDHSEMEALLERHSRPLDVSTTQLRLRGGGGTDMRLVLPGVHPGPYHPVGGSNIPYLIYKSLDSAAMVMHSVSNHTHNLPSRGEVERYLDSLKSSTVAGSGSECTEPVTAVVNRARAIGVMFEGSALLVLSLSPHGMEDLPTRIKSEIEAHARKSGIERVMVVDSHNAMGAEISGPDEDDMLAAARSCLDSLRGKPMHAMEAGYANSGGMGIEAPDLGMGGLGVLCLRVNGTEHFLAWADANNMENGMREHIVGELAGRGMGLLDVCTSDTHYSRTTVRTRNGYYQFGAVTPPERAASWFAEIASRAAKSAGLASFEVLVASARVRIMGEKVFEDYSAALYRALGLTKAHSALGLGVFVASLALVP